MKAEERLMTAEELLRLPDDGMRHELIRGVLTTMPPPGALHELLAGRILRLIGNHADTQNLGWVFGAPGVLTARNPDVVRAPDFAFVARSPTAEGSPPEGYLEVAPDLIAEVVSPSDTASEVHEKILDWLAAGVRIALAFYPRRKSIVVYRSASDVRLLGSEDTFDGGDVLPGFTCPVRDFFPD